MADQEPESTRDLRTLIAEGLTSGDPRAVSDEVMAELRERAFSQER